MAERELVIGVPDPGPSIVTLPVDLARTSPVLVERGLRLKTVVGSYSELDRWLADGSIDLCRRGPEADVVSRTSGRPIVSCAALMQAVPAEFVVREEIVDPAQLLGQKIAVIDPAMGSTLALRTWLSNVGVEQDGVVFEVHGATRERLRAVASHGAAGTIVPPPLSFGLPSGLRVMSSLDEALGPFLFSAVQVLPATAMRRRGDIETFLSVLMEAVRRIREDDIAEDVARALVIDLEQASAVLARAREHDWFPHRLRFGAEPTRAMVGALQRFGHRDLHAPVDDWIWDDARAAAAGDTPC